MELFAGQRYQAQALVVFLLQANGVFHGVYHQGLPQQVRKDVRVLLIEGNTVDGTALHTAFLQRRLVLVTTFHSVHGQECSSTTLSLLQVRHRVRCSS